MDSFENRFKNAIVAFNFDDFIILPGFVKAEPKDVKLHSRFSKNIKINLPIVSSPMDTVTESAMAIALAKKGGIGVVHRNCTSEEEVEMLKAVKAADAAENAAVDEKGRLLVAAGTSPFDLDRAKQLSKHADALVIDVAHFYNPNIIDNTRKIIKETGIDVVIGSFGTKDAVVDCLTKLDGAAGLRVGIGSGSICTTTDVTRAGCPTLFGVAQSSDALNEIGLEIPIIADGGIRTAGDIVLAAAFGASSAMLGYMLAGCKESPGQMKSVDDMQYKMHRGMGSRAAREKRSALDRYANLGGKNLEEGVEMLIPYSGELNDVVDNLSAGIRAAIGYAGGLDMADVRNVAKVAKIDTRNYKIGNKAFDRKALLY